MENNDILIKVDGLAKKFCKDFKHSLKYGAMDIFGNLTGTNDTTKLRKKEFWALEDISFELRRGECLGLIGHNGAGKSTLLKILNGLISPDKGTVTMNGRVGALIELGTGFNPILTGRENIYNNGAVLGFSRKEIDAKIDEIIDFAEVGDFIDSPVQNYSSGMRVRLGFAVAAQMEPDVLLIDEILAVGDAGFRMKSFAKMQELMSRCAIVFVTHSMVQITRVCTHAMYLEGGRCKFYGNNMLQAVEFYFSHFDKEHASIETGGHQASVSNILVTEDGAGEVGVIRYFKDVYVSFNLQLNVPDVAFVDVMMMVIDKDLKGVGMMVIRRLPVTENFSEQLRCRFNNCLVDGSYYLKFSIYESLDESGRQGAQLYSLDMATRFKVVGTQLMTYVPVHIDCSYEVVNEA
ncbi:MAG: ABC transporter ATP-binding protein [Flavobacteriales bacterium]|nr:ABC transporter ATP-binding protein [Flavobacteriales bacterium]